MKNKFIKSIKSNKKSNFKNNQNLEKLPSNQVWIIGKHPVLMALKQARRKYYSLLVSKNNFNEIENFLKQNSLNNLLKILRVVDLQEITNAIGLNHVHQGFALLASKLEIIDQLKFLEQLNQSDLSAKLPYLLLLDQITDPQNVGAIIRSAIAFGFNKIIFTNHLSVIENSTVIKASAGNIEFAEIIAVTNFNQLIEKLKKIGYWFFGLDSHANTSISKVNEFKNIALMIGSEGEGIRQLVKKNCDFLLKVHTTNQVESLNVSVACAIALYEISKINNV